MPTTEENLEKQIELLKQKLAKTRKNKKFRCPNCNQITPLRKLDLLISQFYVEPYSCTGGDYWTEGDNPTYYITCPKCNKENRIYSCLKGPLYQFVKEYRWNFRKRGTRYHVGYGKSPIPDEWD